MDWTTLVSGLAIVTLVIVLVLALVNKRKVDKRRADPNSERSTLAKDKSSTGHPPDV
ncbi:hypothetical protein [Pseudosulfitobacter koreensis]|uniref:LPXTG-motif cell wall anchor domain-containing protein n=1 Tax=Pseudosulfitobacter koreensis TaxID=2968472 RepID=A0ABT1Z3B7_9RHOB|nr:hypothetical protein [Pseudosulfitobacter koreense]MCR8827639.1 hypothetical protein [Pseudosulfitobacter koreense]